jgi:hypothetical protein
MVTHRFLAAIGVLIACALAASLMTATSASARSQGFQVSNLTAKPLKLKEIQLVNDAKFETGETAPPSPKVGDVLMPGVDNGPKYDHNNIELEYGSHCCSDYYARIFYGGERDYGARLSPFRRHASCEWFSPDPFCAPDGTSILFLDAPGTVNELAAADPHKQSEFLRRLCHDANLKKLVTCEFDVTQPEKATFGSPHLVGLTAPNCAEETGNAQIDAENTIDVDLEEKDKTGTENSLDVKIGVEAQFGLFVEKLRLSIETSYGHKWTSEHEFAKKLSYKVRPGYIGWVVATNPVSRALGDLTVKIGNTTVVMRGVYFDNPDPDREGEVQWKPVREKMTPEQLTEICEDGNLSARAEAFHATISQQGTRGADVMYGGRESTTLVARGGNDILRGASGHDRLFGGPGRDRIFAGPGSDTIVDSRGRTWVSTGAGGHSGPDSVDVRDGQGNDTVICGSGDATVLADRGDRVSRRCSGRR